MAIITAFNVEMVTRTGTCLYLQHIAGVCMEWSTDPDAAFEYDSEEEAAEDAAIYGGEVFKFERVDRRLGHNSAARLEAAHREAAE
jgi:predicted dithiol-disulfide oxidoreductase (DUF899 family)